MKRCPKCNLQYDETLFFCLEDGTPLLRTNDPDATLVLPQTFPTSNLSVAHVPSVAPHERPARHSLARFVYGIVLLLAVLGAAVSLALFYGRDKHVGDPAQSLSSTPSESKAPAQEPRSSANESRKTLADPTDRPKSYPMCGSVMFCVGDRKCVANLDEKLIQCTGQGYDTLTEVRCDGTNFSFTRPGDHHAVVRGAAVNSSATSGTYFESGEHRSIVCRQ